VYYEGSILIVGIKNLDNEDEDTEEEEVDDDGRSSCPECDVSS